MGEDSYTKSLLTQIELCKSVISSLGFNGITQQHVDRAQKRLEELTKKLDDHKLELRKKALKHVIDIAEELNIYGKHEPEKDEKSRQH